MWTWKGGGGVSQMSMLLHKPYLVKWSTKGGGGSKISKKLSTWFMDAPFHVHMVYEWPPIGNIFVHANIYLWWGSKRTSHQPPATLRMYSLTHRLCSAKSEPIPDEYAGAKKWPVPTPEIWC